MLLQKERGGKTKTKKSPEVIARLYMASTTKRSACANGKRSDRIEKDQRMLRCCITSWWRRPLPQSIRLFCLLLSSWSEVTSSEDL